MDRRRVYGSAPVDPMASHCQHCGPRDPANTSAPSENIRLETLLDKAYDNYGRAFGRRMLNCLTKISVSGRPAAPMTARPPPVYRMH